MSPFMQDCGRDTEGSAKNSRARSFVSTPAKLEDVRRLVNIEFRAFEDEQVNQVLSFRDYKKPLYFERKVHRYREAMIAGATPGDSSEVLFKKVIDMNSDEIISFAKVEIKAYTTEELCTPFDCGHEEEPRMNRDWFALNERTRREYAGGERHYYIAMLATLPRHQHHGAGTILLQEILSEADNAGVEVYLEATDTARPFYEKHGFLAIAELRFDPAKYGVRGLGVERQTVMVRGALDTTGLRRPLGSWDGAGVGAKAQL